MIVYSAQMDRERAAAFFSTLTAFLDKPDSMRRFRSKLRSETQFAVFELDKSESGRVGFSIEVGDVPPEMESDNPFPDILKTMFGLGG